MVARNDTASGQCLDIDIADILGRQSGGKAKRQIEIAIVERPVPGDRNLVAAHEMLDRVRIKILAQEIVVRVEGMLPAQVAFEAANGYVRDRVQIREYDSEAVAQFAAVVCLEPGLGGWKRWPNWVVHQVKRKSRLDAVSDSV